MDLKSCRSQTDKVKCGTIRRWTCIRPIALQLGSCETHQTQVFAPPYESFLDEWSALRSLGVSSTEIISAQKGFSDMLRDLIRADISFSSKKTGCSQMTLFSTIKKFYLTHLPQSNEKGHWLTAPCPFCQRRKTSNSGQIVVLIDPESYFRGYFRCTDHCQPGGFYIHFAHLMGIETENVPGRNLDMESYAVNVQFPTRHLGAEIEQFKSLMKDEPVAYFSKLGISQSILKELQVGFNGRYLVFPYFQDNGFAYAARCVMLGSEEETFWHGNDAFSKEGLRLYNVQEIERCAGGALFITEGELNLLILKSLGYPAICVPTASDLQHIELERLRQIQHIFLLVTNTPEARQSARDLATQLGFKARILAWPSDFKRGHHLCHLAVDTRSKLKSIIAAMVHASQSFSPFASPLQECRQLSEFLEKEKGKTLLGIETGFSKLNQALDGLRGINILGGPPKAGKSCFFIQISTEIAQHKIPVIYYDFENGRQKIYLRTLVRTSQLPEKKIRQKELNHQETLVLQKAWRQFEQMLPYFRVVTDRNLTPDIMRRHIDFLKHECRTDEILIVLDSLHKLPFKSLTERRTGIDFWLRQIEAIRDEHQVVFLVISELSRKDGGYGEIPDMTSFKESGDIEYSADNAMILIPQWNPLEMMGTQKPHSVLWLVASRENNPGRIAQYRQDYPYWRFHEF